MMHFLQQNYLNGGAMSASRKHFIGDASAHGHDFFEIEYVLSGSGEYEIDGVRHTIREGMLVLLSPANVHRVKGANAELINVMFRADTAEDYFVFSSVGESPSTLFFLEGEDKELLCRLLCELTAVHRSEEGYAALLLRTVLHKLRLLSPAPTEREHSSYLQKASLFALQHFKSGIGLGDVAAHLGLSATYFSDLFHRQTGLTFQEYLDNLRFAYACNLLTFTDTPIKELHVQAGFRDYANFTRRFKARFGVTPSSYKRDRRKKTKRDCSL